MNRRDFLSMTTTSAAALMASVETVASAHKPAFNMNKAFDLKILATNWGFPGTMDEFCAKAKKEGYDGIENWFPSEKKEQDELFAALKKHGLEVGFLVGGYQSNWQEHLETFKKMVDGAASVKPLFINCHSGRDWFSYDQNKAFIDYTTEVAKKTGVLICHETHRGRILYSASVSRPFIEKLPDLRITFDVSHWCNVHESLLEDQQETVNLTLDRVSHIHARIGHQEGPQVNDPRAPEWEKVVSTHFGWWDKVVERKKKNNERLTILTEFGPPDYMPTLPYTRQALADQWAINVHMMHLLRKRYS